MAVMELSLVLYHDHNVHDVFAIDLRQHQFDVVLAREVGNEEASDEEQLRWATAHGRVIITHDLKDFPPLAEQWFLEGRDHAGIILSLQPGPGVPYSLLRRRLFRLLEILTGDDMINRVEWLDAKWDDPGG